MICEYCDRLMVNSDGATDACEGDSVCTAAAHVLHLNGEVDRLQERLAASVDGAEHFALVDALAEMVLDAEDSAFRGGSSWIAWKDIHDRIIARLRALVENRSAERRVG